MMELWFRFVVGIGMLLLATRYLVEGGVRMGRRFKLSPLIMGVTVVSIGTSLPELTVSLIAALKGDLGLAIGNIVGSNIVNVFMVLGTGVVIGKIRVGTKKTQRSGVIALIATLLFIVSSYVGGEVIKWGWVLLTGAVVVTLLELVLGVKGRKKEDRVIMKAGRMEKLGAAEMVGFCLAFIGVVGGGLITVNTVETVAVVNGWSTTILGLSLTAIATSLPELLATIIAEEEHEEKVALGNVIGSNIYNLLLIGGLIGVIEGVGRMKSMDLLWLLLSAVGLVLILRRYMGKVIPRWVGLALLSLFGVYLVTLGFGV